MLGFSRWSAVMLAGALMGAGCSSSDSTPPVTALSELQSAADFEFKSFNSAQMIRAGDLSHDLSLLPDTSKVYISFWAGEGEDRFQIGLTSVAGFMAMDAKGGYPMSHQVGHEQVAYQIYGSPIAGQLLTGSIAR